MAEEVKVLGFWASPFSRRVELALKLKGVEYEYIEEDLSNKSNLLLESNLVHKKVPVLIHKGKPIAESLVILEYIDETWKNNPLLPTDPFDKAVARFWAKFIDDKFLAPARKLATTLEGPDRKKAFEEVQEHLNTLEDELKGKDFFGGDKLGFVDIVANVVAFWFPISEELMGWGLLTEERYPLIFKWIQKLVEIPVVLECKPPKDKQIAHFKDMIARLEASKASPK